MERQTTFDRVLRVIGTVAAVAGLLSSGLVLSDVGALLPLVVRTRSRTAVSPRAKRAVVIGAMALSLPIAVIALIPSPTTHRSCIA